MKISKGFADGGILLILAFFGLFAWRMTNYKPGISCEEYQKNIDNGKRNKGVDKKDHFYHNHGKK